MIASQMLKWILHFIEIVWSINKHLFVNCTTLVKKIFLCCTDTELEYCLLWYPVFFSFIQTQLKFLNISYCLIVNVENVLLNIFVENPQCPPMSRKFKRAPLFEILLFCNIYKCVYCHFWPYVLLKPKFWIVIWIVPPSCVLLFYFSCSRHVSKSANLIGRIVFDAARRTKPEPEAFLKKMTLLRMAFFASECILTLAPFV